MDCRVGLLAVLFLSLGLATGCSQPDEVDPIEISLQVERASCGITELEEYPLPVESSLALWEVSDDVISGPPCKVAMNTDGETLADLASVAEEIKLRFDLFFEPGSPATSMRLSFFLYLGRHESCADLFFLDEQQPLLHGQSAPFDPSEVLREQAPVVVIPIGCTEPQ